MLRHTGANHCVPCISPCRTPLGLVSASVSLHVERKQHISSLSLSNVNCVNVCESLHQRVSTSVPKEACEFHFLYVFLGSRNALTHFILDSRYLMNIYNVRAFPFCGYWHSSRAFNFIVLVSNCRSLSPVWPRLFIHLLFVGGRTSYQV